MLKHLPNAVTTLRGLAGPLVAWLLIAHHANYIAFWIFVAAIATDLVDGWLARLLDARSAMGLWLDPLADKLLTDSVWVALWWIGFAPGWLCGLVVIRDAGVALAWAWAAPRHLIWSPTPIGQVMVAFEGVAVSVLVFHGPWLDVHWPSVGVVLGTITLALSAVSILQYVSDGPQRAPESTNRIESSR